MISKTQFCILSRESHQINHDISKNISCVENIFVSDHAYTAPSTRMGGKSKLRKASLPLVMHLKLDFSSTVTRVTLEWLTVVLYQFILFCPEIIVLQVHFQIWKVGISMSYRPTYVGHYHSVFEHTLCHRVQAWLRLSTYCSCNDRFLILN